MRERCRFCKCGRAASSFGYDRRRPLKLAIKLATHRKTSTTSAPIIAKVNIVPPSHSYERESRLDARCV